MPWSETKPLPLIFMKFTFLGFHAVVLEKTFLLIYQIPV